MVENEITTCDIGLSIRILFLMIFLFFVKERLPYLFSN